MLKLEVFFCPRPGQVDAVLLQLPEGTTLAQALQASGLLDRHALTLDGLKAGVWSLVKPLETVLRDADRVEIYRPLTVDPKEARRLRYKRQRGEAAAKAA